VAKSLGLAERAARRGDHRDALAWLNMVDSLGVRLPREYEYKRRAWRARATQ